MAFTDLDSPVSSSSKGSQPAETNVQEPLAGPGGELSGGGEGMEDVPNYRPVSPESVHSSLPANESLRDIGELVFGPPPARIEAIIGTDDRVQVGNTSTYPWSAIASLRITAADNSVWSGTGWFIGPHTVATAGHCVFIRNAGSANGWVKSIQVIPGRNGASQPFGSATSSSFVSVTGWTNNGDQEYDYGAIQLSTNLGNSTGTFGFGAYNDATLIASIANISGYPGDKPAGTQWFHARKVTSVGTRKVYYDVDTAPGQSGAPVWRFVDGKRYGIAIHAYGGTTSNSGTRITTGVFNNFVAWRA